VTVLDKDYKTTPEALKAISTDLTSFYEKEYPDVMKTRAGVVKQAVSAVQTIYQKNFFPEMKVSWKAYPDDIGHWDFLGCFRCHGSDLETASGKKISKDCSLCHTILAQGVEAGPKTISPRGLKFQHPVDIGGAEFESNCTECHAGGAELY
jgi:hypothetical protein